MNRRDFLSTAVTGTALSGLVLAKDGKRIKRLGLQLYTIRDAMKADFEGSLARVAQLGYREVEFAGYFDHSPQQVKELLKKNRLSSPSSHIGMKELTDGLSKQIDTAHVIGQKYLVCPALPENMRKTTDDWKRVAETFNKIGADCKKAGLGFAYHNHNFEFQAIDGQMPYDLLLSHTDPRLVKLEMDLYWVVKANQDPVNFLQKQPGRFPLVHVKDMQNTPDRGFAEVGKGTMDFKRIFQAGEKAGIKHFIVEQDQTSGDPFESIKISSDYLKTFKY